MTKIKEKPATSPVKNRRISPDFWVYAAKYLAILSWLLFIIGLVISYYAAPETNYGIVRFHGFEVRKFWLTPLTGYLYVILWSSALLSYCYLFIEHYRSRRKSDSKHGSLLLLLIITVAWVIYIMFNVR